MRYSFGSVVIGVLLTTIVAEEQWTTANITEGAAEQALVQGQTCCGALSFFLGDKVAYPDSTAYEASIDSYWSNQVKEVAPKCIFTPENRDDVSLALFVLDAGKVLPDCSFAVRSGGHTPFVGANIDNLVIDLQKLRQLEISSETVRIGPGNRWIDVYTELDKKGIATIGGRAASVGVGGLITGGGVSFFSPRYGYVADNVEDFEVVLAGGKVVHANAGTNKDLWVALRGGSNNFGIVTSFTMRTFPQGELWGGFIGPVSDVKEQFEAFEALTGQKYDPFAAMIFNLVWNSTSNTWYTSHNLVYTKPERPPVFERFLAFPQRFNTTRISNLTSFAVELDASNPSGRRQLFATGTYKNSAVMMNEFFRISRPLVEPLQTVPLIKWSFSFQPLPTVIQAVAETNGGNSLGLSTSDGNLFNVLLTATWDTSSDDELVEKQAKNLFEEANAKAKEMGVFHKYVYLNYAASWQDPIAGYGAASKANLQAVSRKYDPNGMFQKQVPGGFKLFR